MAKILKGKRGDRPDLLSQQQKKLTHWDQLNISQRASNFVWFDSLGGEQLVNRTNQSSGISMTLNKPDRSTVPRNATNFIVITSILSNTATGGCVRFNVWRDYQNATFDDAAFAIALSTINTNAIARQQGVIPVVNGGMLWETSTAGANNYDLIVYLVGYVLE